MRAKPISRRGFLATALAAGPATWLAKANGRPWSSGYPPAPNAEEWLNAHPNVRDALVWYYPDPNGSGVVKRPYTKWTAGDKKSLQQMVDAAWNNSQVLLDDPPVNLNPPNQFPSTVLKPIDAFEYYLNGVGHSLAVEMGNRVPWSVQNYSPENLAILFDGSWIFSYDSQLKGMRIHAANNGYYTPSPPQLIWNFLQGIGVFAPPPARRPDPIRTPLPGVPYSIKLPPSPARWAVGQLFDWCRNNLTHANQSNIPATEEKNAIWQYSGFPPISRIISGTLNTTITTKENPPRHWTEGCRGTVGFLSGVLRTINVPVKHVELCGHGLPLFPTLDAVLSHGDDLYDGLAKAGGSNPALPYPSTELFTSLPQFDSWFGPSAANKCANVGRRPVELALEYLPYQIAIAYCKDKKSGAAKSNGQVFAIFKQYYSVADLESKDLWGRLDKKLAAGFDCGGYA